MPFSVLKGVILCRKFPEIYRTGSGKFHLIFRGVNANEEEMMRLRRLIGDDKKRIHLDKVCKLKPQQILFTKKVVKYYKTKGKIDDVKIYVRRRII